jgi:hypothetical protein
MYYALKGEPQPIYERDEYGNIIYIIIGGEQIPKETGDVTNGISSPVPFKNSVGSNLTQDEIEAFGVQGRTLASMTYKRGEYPFEIGTLIWLNSEVRYLESGEVDEGSADFVVAGINTTGRHFWRAILRSNAKNETD